VRCCYFNFHSRYCSQQCVEADRVALIEFFVRFCCVWWRHTMVSWRVGADGGDWACLQLPCASDAYELLGRRAVRVHGWPTSPAVPRDWWWLRSCTVCSLVIHGSYSRCVVAGNRVPSRWGVVSAWRHSPACPPAFRELAAAAWTQCWWVAAAEAAGREAGLRAAVCGGRVARASAPGR